MIAGSTGQANMIAGSTGQAILHLHPLRRCNLRCLHCYSDSSPSAQAMLSFEESIFAIREAARWGYKVLSISGGEPLLYPWLYQVLQEAKSLGMKTSLVTNGMLLNSLKIATMVQHADVIAISVDGLSNSHDLMRRRVGAYDSVKRSLCLLRDKEIPFVVNCSVTAQNIDEIEDIAEMVWQHGAYGIQFHPIEMSPRATNNKCIALTQDEANILFVAISILALQYQNRMTVRVNAVHREWIVNNPQMVYGHKLENDLDAQFPAALLGVLVIDPDGELIPVSYGFPEKFYLGNFRRTPMDKIWSEYLQNGYLDLRALGRKVLQDIKNGNDNIFNPNEMLVQYSHKFLTKKKR